MENISFYMIICCHWLTVAPFILKAQYVFVPLESVFTINKRVV